MCVHTTAAATYYIADSCAAYQHAATTISTSNSHSIDFEQTLYRMRIATLIPSNSDLQSATIMNNYVTDLTQPQSCLHTATVVGCCNNVTQPLYSLESFRILISTLCSIYLSLPHSTSRTFTLPHSTNSTGCVLRLSPTFCGQCALHNE